MSGPELTEQGPLEKNGIVIGDILAPSFPPAPHFLLFPFYLTASFLLCSLFHFQSSRPNPGPKPRLQDILFRPILSYVFPYFFIS